MMGMVVLVTVISITGIVLILAAWILTFEWTLPRIPRSNGDTSNLPSVSIIVPARDEEKNIRRCLTSLAEQEYDKLEIIAVDDRSSDQTKNIIVEMATNSSHIKLVEVSELPEGWIGKCNALHVGARNATGDWLLFTDADTRHERHGLADSISYALSHKIDLLTYWPLLEVQSFWEKVTSPVLWTSFFWGDPIHFANDLLCDIAYANGQYILIDRRVYLGVGGHEAVRGEILEDAALAQLAKDRGCDIRMCDGTTIFRVRMYTGLKEFWAGWAKNLYLIERRQIAHIALVLFRLIVFYWLPVLELVALAVMWSIGQVVPEFNRALLLVLLQYCAVLIAYERTRRRFDGLPWGYALLLPVGAGIIGALYLYSTYRIVSGGTFTWKGRSYVATGRK